MLDELTSIDREGKIDNDCATAVGGAVGLAHLVDNLRHHIGIGRLHEFEE